MSRLLYDSLGAVLAGQRGPVHIRYRLYRSDIYATMGDFIANVDGGDVSMSNFRDHAWEITFTRKELVGTLLSELGDYVRLFVHVREASGEWREFPFGMFYLDPASAVHDMATSTYSVMGRSPEVLLLDDYAHNGYLVPVGTGVLARARAILESKGVPPERINFPSADKTLNTPLWFDQFQDFSRCAYLRIVNALLNAGGFYALYTDATGTYTTKEIEEAGTGEADVLYSSEGPHRMVVGPIEEEYDLEGFANRVVVYSGDPNQSGTLAVGVATNDDPDSPGSVQNLGRVVIGEPVELQNIVSAAEARKLAAAELKRRTAVSHKANVSVLPDPRRGPREDCELNVRRPNRPDPDGFGYASGEPGKALVTGRWTVIGWTLPLTSPPQPMSVELTRAERLTASAA